MFDYLLDGWIKMVINLPASGDGTLTDSVRKDQYAIRRLAVEHYVPVLTTLELANAAVEGLQYLKLQEPEVLALNDYVADGKATARVPV